MIDANTIPTILIGHPIEHSKSPVFQNAGFMYFGINSIYLAIDINESDFDTVISGLKKIKILGMNITLPYKHDVIKFTDELSEDAKIINAVNTVEVNGSKWIGHNTDWYGAYKTLEVNKIPKNQTVLIIGAGGATPGVIYGLKNYGIDDITITNRTIDKAKILQDQFSTKLINYENYKKLLNEFSMIINCTSINFYELFDLFNDKIIYFYLKYYVSGINTKKYIDGRDMLLYQGAKSFSIWTKKDAPLDIMRKALNKAL